MTTVTPDDVRAGLHEAALRRARARHDEAEAMADITEWVRRGKEAGIGLKEMAEIARVSRTTVYAMTGGE